MLLPICTYPHNNCLQVNCACATRTRASSELCDFSLKMADSESSSSPEQGSSNNAQPPPPDQQPPSAAAQQQNRNNKNIYCRLSSSLCHLLQTQPDYSSKSWDVNRALAYRPDASSESVEEQLARAGGDYLKKFRGGYWRGTKSHPNFVDWANQAMAEVHE